MTTNFTDDYKNISSFNVQQFGTEKTKIGKVLGYIGLGKLIADKKVEICVALGTTHDNNNHHIYTPFDKNLTVNDIEIVYNHLNNPQTIITIMHLMNQETIDTFHAIEKNIHSQNPH